MTCTRVGSAIVCGRGGRGSRICDICDHIASGPKEQLRDGRTFDVCGSCRRRIAAARAGTEEQDWVDWAHRQVAAALSGERA